MTMLADLPPELVERIVILADPLDIPAFSRVSSWLYATINPPNDQRLWQALYLAQPLDDPRKCCDQFGRPSYSKSSFDWKKGLQRIMRARKVVMNPTFCPLEDRCEILQTLLHLITNIPQTPSLAHNMSMNLAWVVSLLQGNTYLDTSFTLSPEEDQLRARIHCHFGLTELDLTVPRQTKARGYIYDMRHYRLNAGFGPFMLGEDVEEDDQGSELLVNWVHVQAIHHVMSMHLVNERLEEFTTRKEAKTGSDEYELKHFMFIHYPLSLPYCQTVISDGLDLDSELDWAGVEGLWRCYFCYFDHRELLFYNRYGVSETELLDASIFDRGRFREVLHAQTIELHITESEADLQHPTRPKLHFASDDASQPFTGWVAYTCEDHIRWYFEYGENGQMMWSSSGVQVGAVRSPFGVVGGWTTVHHAPLSPVGPFWFHRINDAIVRRQNITDVN